MPHDHVVEKLRSSTPVCLHQQEELMFQYACPRVTSEHESMEFYTYKTPRWDASADGATNTVVAHLDYALTYDTARRSQNQAFTSHISPPPNNSDKGVFDEIQSYGIVKHFGIIPVYTLQYVDNSVFSPKHEIATVRYIDPEALDVMYDRVLRMIQHEETSFLYSLGHSTMKSFLQSSPISVVLRHYTTQEFLRVDARFIKIREKFGVIFQERAQNIVLDHNISFSQFQLVQLQQMLFQQMTNLMYGWFIPEEHRNYPLEWLLMMYAPVESVAEESEVVLEKLLRELTIDS